MSDSDVEMSEENDWCPDAGPKGVQIYWNGNDSTIDRYVTAVLKEMKEEDFASLVKEAHNGRDANFKASGTWYHLVYEGGYLWIKSFS